VLHAEINTGCEFGGSYEYGIIEYDWDYGIGETKISSIYCKYMKLSNSTAMLYSPWRVLGIYYLLTICIETGLYGVT